MSCNNYTATQIPVSVGFDADGNAGSLVETKEIKVTKIEAYRDPESDAAIPLIIDAGEDNEIIFPRNVRIDGTLTAATVTVEGASALSALTDVTITSVANGEVLVWSSNDWINRTLSEAGIVATGDLANYATTGSLTGYVPTGTLSNYVQTTALNNYVATTSVGVTVQAYGTALQAIRALTPAADRLPYFNGGSTAATATLTTFARTNLLAATDGATVVANINAQTYDASLEAIASLASFPPTGGDVITWDDINSTWTAAPQTGGGASNLNSLTDVTISTAANNDFLVYNGSQWVDQDPSVARASLGATTVGASIFTLSNPTAVRYLRINADNTVSTRTAPEMQSDLSVTPGTNVQTQNANLQSIANQTTTANTLIYFSGSASAATTTLTQFGRSLLDDANAIECRGTLSAQLSSVPLDNLTNLCTGTGSTGASAYGRLFYSIPNGLTPGTSLVQVPLFDINTIANNYGKVLKLTDNGVPATGTYATPAWGSVAQSEITGLTTGDTPTFAGLNVGNADTAITRTSAGNIAVAGQTIYRQGGTDVAIADGGTGISTAPNAGEVLVGQLGNTYALQSGATLRTSIGLGTGNSPQFSEVNIGHASDTTITRTTAGVIAVEGKRVFALKSTDTLDVGDIFYYDGTDFRKLASPASQVGVLINYPVGDGNPAWIEIPGNIATYTLKSVAGTVQWVED